MDHSVVRGRFAPSPTGRMHLGNVYSALMSWLYCKKENGQMVLRIEDLDPDRSRMCYAEMLEEDLHWLGLDWDEGGSISGDHAPYYQSRCQDYYSRILDELRKQAEIYPCFCSRGELHVAGAPHDSDGVYLYRGTCFHMPAEEIKKKSLSRSPSFRIHIPKNTWISFSDGNYGPVTVELSSTCGDFILRRSDGVYSYQLAVVADDIRMGITQVVRGRDLLSSTPRQIWLYRLLGQEPPAYIHVPLLVSNDGKRLSKRDMGLNLSELRKTFRAPQIIGRLAFLAGLIPEYREMMPGDLLSFTPSSLRKEDIVCG